MKLNRRALVTTAASLLAIPGMSAAQARRQRAIGLLAVDAPGSDLFQRLFRRDMTNLGFVEGRDVRYLFRVAGADRLDEVAAELVREPVDLLVTWYTPAALAAKRATREIPIVMALAGNPVETGIVTNLQKPDGNITGLSGTSAELGRKCMELVREILPDARVVATLANGRDSFSRPFLELTRTGGEAVGLATRPLVIMDPERLPEAFDELVRDRPDALIVQPSLPRKRVAELALGAHFPALSVANGFINEGGLISYAASEPDLSRRAAAIADRVLKGTPPAQIPIELPSKYSLQVNLKTARALGLTIPEQVLARADELIE